MIEVWPFSTMTVQSGSAENGESQGLQLTGARIGLLGRSDIAHLAP